MEALQFCSVDCPYCGESIEVSVDLSAGDQSYVEDCQVCCRPIEMRLSASSEDWRLEVLRDDQ
jgi:transcription elongation factor Elf1